MADIRVKKGETHDTPSTGYSKIYPKSDGKWYRKNDDGVEEELGAGSGGGAYTDLTDTPGAHVAKKIPVVNDTGDALTYNDLPQADFAPQEPNPAHKEGRIFYDDSVKSFTAYNDLPGQNMYLGRSIRGRGVNRTGGTLVKGTVVTIGDFDVATSLPRFEVAVNYDLTSSSKTIAVLPYDILNDAEGEGMTVGPITEFDSSSFSEGDVLWLDTDGTMTNVKPPAPHYPVRLGLCAFSDVANGILIISVSPFTGSDTNVNSDGGLNGICTQKQGVTFTVEGGVIYADVINEQTPSMSLPFMIGGTRYSLDTLTGTGVGGAARVALTEGTPTAPQINFLYIENDPTPTLKSSTTFPSSSKAWVGIVSVFDSTTTSTDGPFSWQRFNNAIDNGDGDGIFNYITQRLRLAGALYQSGVQPTVTIDTGASPDSINVTTSSGIVSQLHSQTFASQNGSRYYVVNDPDVGIRKITDLNQITKYADGTVIADNQRLGLNILGVQSSSGGTDELLVSLPDAGYVNDDLAIADANGYANPNVPSGVNLSSTSFRICRLVLRYDTQGGGQWTNLLGDGNFQDERGALLGKYGAGSGGTGGGAVTDFSDADFSWFNTIDASKVVNVDLSALTTATLRTLAFQDKSGTVALLDDIATKFDTLTDTPADKTGSAGLVPVVNDSETALVYEARRKVLTADLVIDVDFAGGGDFTNMQEAWNFAATFASGGFGITINIINVASLTDTADLQIIQDGGDYGHITLKFEAGAQVVPVGLTEAIGPCFTFRNGVAPLIDGSLDQDIDLSNKFRGFLFLEGSSFVGNSINGGPLLTIRNGTQATTVNTNAAIRCESFSSMNVSAFKILGTNNIAIRVASGSSASINHCVMLGTKYGLFVTTGEATGNGIQDFSDGGTFQPTSALDVYVAAASKVFLNASTTYTTTRPKTNININQFTTDGWFLDPSEPLYLLNQSMDGDFTTGSWSVSKVGINVTFQWSAAQHPSTTSAVTSTPIPAEFRPSTDKFISQATNTTMINGKVGADGLFTSEYRDWSGSLIADTACVGGSISWVLDT